MSNAFIGYGATFGIEDRDNPGTYIDVAEVVGITPPAYTMDTVDTTHLLSPERFREYVNGLREAGELSLTINFVPGDTTSDLLVGEALQDTPGNYKITWPNAVEWGFAGVMVGFAPGDIAVDTKVTATVRVKVTGKPDWFEL